MKSFARLHSLLTLGLATCLVLITTAQPQTASAQKPRQDEFVVDSKFRPETNGFAFENFGGKGEGNNLDAAQVARIFGEAACAEVTEAGECLLTPGAEQWMNQINNIMQGGRCYGFSVVSLLMYAGQTDPGDFGADEISKLTLEGNADLQRELAYAFSHQMLESVQETIVGGTPVEVLDKLIEALKAGEEAYTIAIFKADMTGGHAVTPFAVQEREGGIAAILVYDNNFPGQTREILVDRNANTWTYTASINSSEPEGVYEGNAETKSLSLMPVTPALDEQPCPFCREGAQAKTVLTQGAAPTKYNQIFLSGNPQNNANLLITDSQNRRLGYTEDGKFVNEIPGARVQVVATGDLWNDESEPVYYVPTSIEFTMLIDGTPLKEADKTDVFMIGPGYALGVIDINLEPGQRDALTISADGDLISYGTYSSESPLIFVGVETQEDAYTFIVQGVDLKGTGDKIQVINVGIDLTKKQLSIDPEGADTETAISLYMSKIDDKKEQEFSTDGIPLRPNDVIYVLYDKWTGQGGKLDLALDAGSDGTIDETLSLDDKDLAAPE
jgi:hypothetical protein